LMSATNGFNAIPEVLQLALYFRNARRVNIPDLSRITKLLPDKT